MTTPMVAHLRLVNSTLTTSIDFADIPLVRPYLSTLFLRRGYVYLRKDSWCKLHRFLLDPRGGYEVDHINRDRLDNRRVNLRLATKSQNCQNRGPKGRYKGVTWRKDKSKWQVQSVDLEGKKVHLGYYACDKEAVEAYNRYQLATRGDSPFTYYNVID